MLYDVVSYGQIKVSYRDELDGGGGGFGQAYLPFLQANVGTVDRAFEWCCGPAFIGFSMLAHGLCRELDLADANEQAVAAVRRTIADNDLAATVRVCESDCLADVPEDWRWDLVVGNPPHSGTDTVYADIEKPFMIYMDPGWEIHRRFYSAVAKHLRPGADVIIQENGEFSQPEDFAEMLDAGGLELVRVDDAGRGFYFLWSRVREQ
jgi:methylase of polypeptide subunit release factors